MIGASLSRWTMSYFAAALLALLAAEVMMVGYGFPHASFGAPQTLILVHIVAIGWLSLLMCGALFQFVPVLVAQRLYSDSLPLPTLLLLIAGLAALILGFLQLAGHIDPRLPYFIFAGTLLGVGFTLVLCPGLCVELSDAFGTRRRRLFDRCFALGRASECVAIWRAGTDAQQGNHQPLRAR